MMKLLIFCALVCSSLICCEGLETITDYLSSPVYPCIQCLCHGVSGCWRRQNCARYSVSKEYWMQAGSLVVSAADDPSSDASYRKCLQNENCIVGTIIKYTEQYGEADCNCDEKFDCKDRLAIHLFGNKCEKPSFGHTIARRFNDCAARVGVSAMLSSEGDDFCTLPIVH
ncbi:unnamed protein product [Phaedon cochleariae]|uniref:lysozyme n=1 Tax=Phaedon cochleariae TaxID=80249 RepID=A0A9P0DR22_PHACE|nr:unnamed protein product [Phaedon cochleariae]